MLNLKRLWIAIILALLAVGSTAAQEITLEPSNDATEEATAEATLEPTSEATTEATIEATAEATAESTLPPGTFANFPGPGSYTVRQTYDSIERSYRVYIPTDYSDDGDPAAMLVILHGAGGSGAGIESFTGFNALADEHNFIVVYPDGINNAWNDGRTGDPRIGVVDDVRFLDGVVRFMEQGLNIDPLRVYAAGYSMGGMMSFRVGCELPHRFAAVASVASTMPAYLLDTCSGTPAIPVMVFQGTDDPVIPWAGVPAAYLSAAQTIGFWGSHNTCDPDFAVESLPDITPEDYTLVIRQQLSGCAADMVLYGVYFGGHTWPGHPFNASFQLGQTTHDIDASALMWEFFSTHVNTNVE